MAMAPLMSAVNHSIAAGAVRSNVRAGIAWHSARTSDDLATDAWFSEVDDFIDGIPTDDNVHAFLRFLVRIADEYVACLPEVSRDPKEAAIRLLDRKGVHVTRLLARMSHDEMIGLIAALGELLTALPDRLKLARLGAIFGATTAVGLIANDLLSAANGSKHGQRNADARARSSSAAGKVFFPGAAARREP